ncbi:MAG: ribosome silencing factor [Gemmatimonadota bacterium]|nr:ribosome silencing factor [Gemmatimonadota bacterium]MDP6801780.1 ribosome silencing factor [Gemmatimonadota bacterium]MDP7031144.1 ribosome silencing factor [Gemmatimonadota bacterium]
MDPTRLARRAARLALEKKARDVRVLDLQELTSVVDHFVICSADSDVQVKAIATHIQETMKQEGSRVWQIEGYDAGRWVLLDYVDVVVHVFYTDTRDFYSLETLWGDAKTIEVEEEGETRESA